MLILFAYNSTNVRWSAWAVCGARLHSTLELVELERLATSSHKVQLAEHLLGGMCAVEDVPMEA
jgi:hypothetical protein